MTKEIFEAAVMKVVDSLPKGEPWTKSDVADLLWMVTVQFFEQFHPSPTFEQWVLQAVKGWVECSESGEVKPLVLQPFTPPRPPKGEMQ